jgi:hypothetical protein
MELLNLTLGQLLTVFGAISAFSVALYLLDRARRRQVVPTLRFWIVPGQPSPVTRRRRIQQPVSLLLQLIGMALLLLAIADIHWGITSRSTRNHVLVLDTSSWMGAALPGHPGMTLMDQARAAALGWLRAVPADDRVLVIRADGLATPATGWETDHRAIAKAILESEPGVTALGINQAIEFALHSQQQAAVERPGEVVYSGPGRIESRGIISNGTTSNGTSHSGTTSAETATGDLPNIPALRVLEVADPDDNCGLRSVGARVSPTEAGIWNVLVRARNYSSKQKTVQITLNLGNAPAGARSLQLAPGEEKETVINIRTRAAGVLETRLYPRDSFSADNYAALELPEMHPLRVIAYTSDPGALRAALESDPRISAEFRSPSQYQPPNGALVILHRFRPAVAPQGNAIWIDPPADQSPVRVRQRVSHPADLQWAADQPLTTGVRSRAVQIEEASVFERAPGLIPVAEADGGPVMVARGREHSSGPMVVIGFDPFSGPMRYQLVTPLLIGNALRWISPENFRDTSVTTQSAGAVSAPLSAATGSENIQVVSESGARLPFNAHAKSVDFFAGEFSRVRVITGGAERVYSFSLPGMWDAKWVPPANARHGIPQWTERIRRAPRLWLFLAVIGTALLVAEWLIYGRGDSSRLRIIPGAVGKAA